MFIALASQMSSFDVTPSSETLILTRADLSLAFNGYSNVSFQTGFYPASSITLVFLIENPAISSSANGSYLPNISTSRLRVAEHTFNLSTPTMSSSFWFKPFTSSCSYRYSFFSSSSSSIMLILFMICWPCILSSTDSTVSTSPITWLWLIDSV